MRRGKQGKNEQIFDVNKSHDASVCVYLYVWLCVCVESERADNSRLMNF